jgi:hypothetical protein
LRDTPEIASLMVWTHPRSYGLAEQRAKIEGVNRLKLTRRMGP